MLTRTVKIENEVEKELICYDEFRYWVEDLIQKFVDAKEYNGYPMLPNNWLDGIKIYDKSDNDEKRWIVTHAINLLVECFRHWKVDRDELYGKDGWKKFIY